MRLLNIAFLLIISFPFCVCAETSGSGQAPKQMVKRSFSGGSGTVHRIDTPRNAIEREEREAMKAQPALEALTQKNDKSSETQKGVPVSFSGGSASRLQHLPRNADRQ
ncbi:MAG: hypothetical protein KDD64_00620 [Bdellovibrionales bacterium]|nr:hypothetical protein [Bdellovibrionales bacterium]